MSLHYEYALQCLFGASLMVISSRPTVTIRGGTVPIPAEGRAILFVCALVILVHGLWHLFSGH